MFPFNSNNKIHNFSRDILVINIIFILAILFIFTSSSCKKFISLNAPFSSTNAENVYSTDATAAAILTGIYTNMSKSNLSLDQGGICSISLYTSLSGDELSLFDPNYLKFSMYYKNMLSSIPLVATADYWATFYQTIYIANSAIKGISTSNTLSLEVKKQLIGEAKFIRAFCYFYLANLYGDIPLITDTDWQINSSSKREDINEIYRQIIGDLIEAKNLLSQKYLKSDLLTETQERVRPTKWAAIALLSRVYLYTEKYEEAEKEATEIINNQTLYEITNLNNAFIKNNKEAIWQLQSVGTGINSNTGEGKIFILPTSGPNNSNYPVYLNQDFIKSFDSIDKRINIWTNSVTINGKQFFYPYKYKIGSINTANNEYSTVLRLAEQLLIRSEARAYLNKITESLSDLNIIRNRAVLPNSTTTDKVILLSEIQSERKHELFTEWGHRWLDLKRTNTIDNIMPQIAIGKGGSWEKEDKLYPILLTELQKAPQINQNPGY